jgi:hypothetical protein
MGVLLKTCVAKDVRCCRRAGRVRRLRQAWPARVLAWPRLQAQPLARVIARVIARVTARVMALLHRVPPPLQRAQPQLHRVQLLGWLQGRLGQQPARALRRCRPPAWKPCCPRESRSRTSPSP